MQTYKNFSELYNSLVNKKERDSIRHTIIQTIGISYPTFAKWAKGLVIPNKRYHAAIAKIMGIDDVSELFPTTANNYSELTC